jgi:hypothetical protein
MFPFKIGSTIVHSAKRLQQWIAYLEHEKLPSNSGQLGHQQAYLRVLIKDFWPLWPNEIIYTRISSIETSTTLMHPIQAYYYFINRYYKSVKILIIIIFQKNEHKILQKVGIDTVWAFIYA